MPQCTPPAKGPKGPRAFSDCVLERSPGGDDPSDERFEGWQHFGDYFDLKKSKLREQTQDKVGTEGLRSDVLRGVVAHINGHTVPSRKELWELIAQHGGQFEQYPHASVTHIIVMELPDSKVQEWLRQPAKNRTPHVLPSWITTSIERGKLEPWQSYLLPRLRDSSQRSVFDMRTSALDSAAPCPALSANAAAAAVVTFSPRAVPVASPAADSAASFATPGGSGAAAAAAAAAPAAPAAPAAAASQAQLLTTSKVANRAERSSGEAQSTKTDPDFVRKYFKRSRLHHIGTSRGKYQKYVAETCSKPMSQHAASRDDGRVIMHIDMDCFFASVTMRTRPELRDKPFVVCFASGAIDRPVGEISSANYPARKFGICAGMMSRDALQRCPHLIGVPYEFDNYEAVSDKIYEIFARCIGYESGRIEAVSCDEAYLDLSGLDPKMGDLSQSQPSAAADSMPTPSWDVDRLQWAETWASRIRTEVSAATGCPVSAGLGPNKLIARLATADAKPDGQRVLLDPADIDQHLGSLPVRKLPGLGHTGRKKLQEELRIDADTTVAVVRQRASEESLKRVLGNAYGASLYMMLHGQDHRELETQHVRKSYSAEVNWGVRFDRGDDAKVRKFIQDIADYVSEELQHLGFVASALSIKIKRKKKDATTPYKMLGHGPCDNFTKSTSFGIATSDPKVIGSEALRLYADLNIPPMELRGAGIMMTKLSFVASEQKLAGRMTKYFHPVTHTAAASTHASGKACSIATVESAGAGRVHMADSAQHQAAEELDILASQDDGSDYDDDGRPSFSQTLDPETLSQQSSELRVDLGSYDEETATWNPDTATEHILAKSDTMSAEGSDSYNVSPSRVHATGQSPASDHNSDMGPRTDAARRPSIDRDDFIPRLSQVDPEIMAALGSEWASICVAELSDNQNQRESAGAMQTALGRQQSVPNPAHARATDANSEGARRSMEPPPARVRLTGANSARRSSPGRPASTRGARLNGDRPQKRRKPAQQTLLGMQQNAAKWSQLQQWAETDPEVGAILQGMSKEEQLAMFDDLRQAKSSAAQPNSSHNELARQETSHGRTATAFRSVHASQTTAACAVRAAVEPLQATSTLAESRPEDEVSMCEPPADQGYDGTTMTDCSAVVNQPRAGQATSARANGPREASHDRTAASVTGVQLVRADAHAGTAPAFAAGAISASVADCAFVRMIDDTRMLGYETDFEDLHEASARLVAQHEAPCDSMIDVLALGFWQILEDNQLLAAEAWLLFFRRVVSGSEWRAGASLEWIRGYNKLLERCQQLVHQRHGSFLNITQINKAHMDVTKAETS